MIDDTKSQVLLISNPRWKKGKGKEVRERGLGMASPHLFTFTQRLNGPVFMKASD